MFEYDIALGNPPFRHMIEVEQGFAEHMIYDSHIIKTIKNKSNKFKYNGPFVLPRSVMFDDHPQVEEFRDWLHSDFGLKTVFTFGKGSVIIYGEQGYKGEVSMPFTTLDDVNIDTDFYAWASDGYTVDRKHSQHRTREYFTPFNVVMAGLELLPEHLFLDNSIRFIDTSAGEGAWLLGVAVKRMQHMMTHKQSVKNLFAVELMSDNRNAIIERLMFKDSSLKQLLNKNIKCGDWLDET